MGQTETANAPASWHPEGKFSSRCQIKEQHDLLLFEAAAAAATPKPQEVYMKSDGCQSLSAVSLSCTHATCEVWENSPLGYKRINRRVLERSKSNNRGLFTEDPDDVNQWDKCKIHLNLLFSVLFTLCWIKMERAPAKCFLLNVFGWLFFPVPLCPYRGNKALFTPKITTVSRSSTTNINTETKKTIKDYKFKISLWNSAGTCVIIFFICKGF